MKKRDLALAFMMLWCVSCSIYCAALQYRLNAHIADAEKLATAQGKLNGNVVEVVSAMTAWIDEHHGLIQRERDTIRSK